jgi:hypothetical protein
VRARVHECLCACVWYFFNVWAHVRIHTATDTQTRHGADTRAAAARARGRQSASRTCRSPSVSASLRPSQSGSHVQPKRCLAGARREAQRTAASRRARVAARVQAEGTGAASPVSCGWRHCNRRGQKRTERAGTGRKSRSDPLGTGAPMRRTPHGDQGEHRTQGVALQEKLRLQSLVAPHCVFRRIFLNNLAWSPLRSTLLVININICITICIITMSVRGLMKQNKGWRSLECLFTS